MNSKIENFGNFDFCLINDRDFILFDIWYLNDLWKYEMFDFELFDSYDNNHHS